MKLRITWLAGALVAACSTPADKITAALTDYGVPAAQARCMGERLQDRLDVGQLERLSDIARANRGQTNVSMRRLTDQLDRAGDPKLVAAVVGAAINCII